MSPWTDPIRQIRIKLKAERKKFTAEIEESAEKRLKLKR
jgi:hypothetical protein